MSKKVSHDLTFSIDGCQLTFPRIQEGLQELLTPSSELIDKIEAETKDFASRDNFKLSRESLIKIAIDNYIKKLMVNLINKS